MSCTILSVYNSNTTRTGPLNGARPIQRFGSELTMVLNSRAFFSALPAFLVLCLSTPFAQSPQLAQPPQTPPPSPLAQSLAVRVPQSVKDAIRASVNASNSPTPDDKMGGFHEEGGMWVTTTDKKLAVLPAVPGPYAKPNEGSHIDPELSVIPMPSDKIASFDGSWHVHPRGGVIEDRKTKHNGVITETKITEVFVQQPSPRDIAAAAAPINIIVGAQDETVYFYNSSGVVATEPLAAFFSSPKTLL